MAMHKSRGLLVFFPKTDTTMHIKATLSSALCCLAFADGAAQNAASEIRCGFDGGIPSDFTLIDADGNTPSSDLVKYGFSVGTPWVAYYVEKEQNFVAASTSWYEKSGTSSDWLILPPITVESADAVVAWRAKATDSRYSDGYAVYVTTGDGQSVADFDTSAPLFSVNAEASTWTRHSVSLAKYVGQTVRIAFVNNSTDCSMLYLDDIFAGKPKAARVELDMPYVVKPTDKVTVKGTVTTDLETTVKGFTVGYKYGDSNLTKTFADAEIAPGAACSFEFDTDSAVALGAEATVSVWAEHDGDSSYAERTLQSCSQKMVVEELTGSWCGYCVRGAVNMKSMLQKHPDTFIGIAIHSGDFLSADEYLSYIYSLASNAGTVGYPCSVTSRDYTMGTGIDLWNELYDYITAQPIKATVGLSIEPSGVDGEYTATSRTVFNLAAMGGLYRMAYAIIENDVYEPDDARYRQHNSYAGGTTPMDGYENLDEYVTDYHFEHVARGTIGAPEGISGSLPEYIEAGKEYVHATTFQLPDAVLNADNVQVVAMIVNTHDGTIVNADRINLTNAQTSIGHTPTNGGQRQSQLHTIDGRTANNSCRGLIIVRNADGTVRKIVR